MHRRSFVGVAGAAATTLVAGCSEVTGLLGGDGVDETLEDEQTAQFSAEAGDEYTVTVDVEELEGGNAVSVQIARAGGQPVDARSVEGSETYDVTIEEEGEHVVTVTSGRAHVTVEPA